MLSETLTVTSNNGPQFQSEELKAFFVENDITYKVHSTVATSQWRGGTTESFFAKGPEDCSCSRQKLANGTEHLPQSQ